MYTKHQRHACGQDAVAGKNTTPSKPSFKLKLYRCECDGAECEWAKYKIDNSSCILNTVADQEYQGSATNEWTLRSDRLVISIFTIYLAHDFFLLWADAISCGPIASISLMECTAQSSGCSAESMGMYQLTTSPKTTFCRAKKRCCGNTTLVITNHAPGADPILT